MLYLSFCVSLSILNLQFYYFYYFGKILGCLLFKYFFCYVLSNLSGTSITCVLSYSVLFESCWISFFPYCFSLCDSISVCTLHLYSDSLFLTSAVLSLFMSLANEFFIFYTMLFISSMSIWFFYSFISLLKFPLSWCKSSNFRGDVLRYRT